MSDPLDYNCFDIANDEEIQIKTEMEDDFPVPTRIDCLEEFNNMLDGGGDQPVGAQTLPDIQIQQRLLIIEGRLDDLEEKIDQKFQTMMRKQDNNFARIIAKMDMLQKSMDINVKRRAVQVSSQAPPPKRLAIANPQQSLWIPNNREGSVVKFAVEHKSVPPPKIIAPPKAVYPFSFVKKRVSSMPIHPKNAANPEEILMSRPLVKTVSDMEAFEMNLLLPTYRKSVLTNIKMIGGNSMQSEIGNIVKSLLSNVVQSNYSFHGAQGKGSFHSTKTWDVIRQCVMERYPGTTIDQVKKGVSDLLRNAPGKMRSMMIKGKFV